MKPNIGYGDRTCNCYYSKPPLMLGGINLLFGQSEFSLRASGPLLHLLTSLILWQAGNKIGGVMRPGGMPRFYGSAYQRSVWAVLLSPPIV